MREVDWTKTHVAIAAFDTSNIERKREWSFVDSEHAVDRCIMADDKAALLVQLAFYADTSDRNTLDTCKRISVLNAKRMSKYAG